MARLPMLHDFSQMLNPFLPEGNSTRYIFFTHKELNSG